MRPAFRSRFVTPPTGFYEYEVDGRRVSHRNRLEACRLVVNLRNSLGLPVIGDGMEYIMEYMCPMLPDGWCDQPSEVKTLYIDAVKKDTAQLFPLRVAASDEIERRMNVCMACKEHTRTGFCVDCNGLLEWVYRGFAGKRGKLPSDRVMGLCRCDGVMAVANATIAERDLKPGEKYPAECWRTAGGKVEA